MGKRKTELVILAIKGFIGDHLRDPQNLTLAEREERALLLDAIKDLGVPATPLPFLITNP